jgi:hypothetical protein
MVRDDARARALKFLDGPKEKEDIIPIGKPPFAEEKPSVIVDKIVADKEITMDIPDRKRRKGSKGKVIVILLGVLLTVGILYSAKVVVDYQNQYNEIVKEIRALNVTTPEYNITYSESLVDAGDGWYSLQIKLVNPSSPWQNKIAYIWYNKNTKDMHLEIP